MTNTTRPARATVGKITLGDLLILTLEAGLAIGSCFALHLWMVG